MAVVIVNEIEGGNQELYDDVTSKVMDGGELPDGCQVHIAGPVESGRRVITVWDSEEQFQSFRDEKLIPTVREIAGDDAGPPKIDTDEVYRFIKA